MALHFKFRSAVEYDSVNIEGHFISVANLKEKIIEAKNLRKGTDFDLLITNAQTGEDYADDAFLVPKNTSVIIKRVPASSRTKPTLRVDDQSKSQNHEQSGSEVPKVSDAPVPPPAPYEVAEDSMDDFGVDLYAIPDTLPSRIDAEENNRITAMVNKTASEWQRKTQEPFAGGSGRGFGRLGYGSGRGLARGRGYGRAVPPQGYVCHRCGQPGHFIQHCPTNGDPAYDMRRVKLPVGIPKTRLKADQEGGYILPDGSVAVMQPDESVFAKEADALLSVRPTSAEPPPELRCPLCQSIFKDAVMIPCCHYSFCDKCIRQELISKGKCPQCGSSKFKNDDLLPNIALRQAIDRFLETQHPTTSAEEGSKSQQVPDVDPVSRLKAPPARLQIELRKAAPSVIVAPVIEAVEKEATPTVVIKPESTASLPEKINPADADTNATAEAGQASAVIHHTPEPQTSEVVAVQSSKADETWAFVPPAIVKDVSDPVKGGGMHPVIEDGGGTVVKVSEPASHKEAEGVAVESEVSKGKKKKKRTRPITGDGTGDYMGAAKGKRMQADRFCYICGSPDHLARDCLENPEVTHPPHPGMFGPGHAGLPPYGPEMYWHGPPMPQHGRPFPIGYGEGMYGPGPMPFEVPMMPGGPYGVAPYLPPMYHGAPMHGGFMGGGMPAALGPMERPLSREEFMEMQERERRRRLMQERLHRDWSPERSFSREGNWHPQTPDSEWRRYEHADRRVATEDHQSLIRKHELDRDSIRNFSDENEFYKRKAASYGHKHVSRVNNNAHRRNASNSDDDVASFDELKSPKLQLEGCPGGKTFSVSMKRESRHQRVGDAERSSSEPEYDIAEQSYAARRHERGSKDGDLRSLKVSRQSHSKKSNNGKSLQLSGSGGDGQASRHRSRKSILDGGKYDVDFEEKESVRSGRYSQVRPKSQEMVARFPVNEFSGSEMGGEDDLVRNVEKPKRRKHRGDPHVKADLGTVVSESEDDTKKKKRKHKKHRDEGSHEKLRDGKSDADGDHSSRHRKHKAKNGSYGISPSPFVDLEQTRWQLDSGYDAGITSHRLKQKHNKDRRVDSGKVK